MAYQPSLQPCVWLSRCWMRMTTGHSFWRKSIRSNCLSERNQRRRGPWREIPSTVSSPLTGTRDPMQRSPTASRKETSMASSSSSPRPAWCPPRSFPLRENMTFLRYFISALCQISEALWNSAYQGIEPTMIMMWCVCGIVHIRGLNLPWYWCDVCVIWNRRTMWKFQTQSS